jgi:hypothetical protein
VTGWEVTQRHFDKVTVQETPDPECDAPDGF